MLDSTVGAVFGDEATQDESIVTRAEALDRGRESGRVQAWAAAFSNLSAADQQAPLDPDDLELFAMAARLIGREADSAEILARAHQGFLNTGDTRRASRCAFWLGFMSLINGESAQASGWLARARRLIEDKPDCLEQGYLLLADGVRLAQQGAVDNAYKAFVQVAAIAHRFADRDLTALALNGQGRALVRRGEIATGVTMLDEAMVAVATGEISPLVAGAVYCSVIASCRETFDLRRAQEWTAALAQWCDSHPEVISYRGACLLHRAEIMHLRGAWPEALDEARRACKRLSESTPRQAVGAAFYCIAELHRLRGEFAEAEEAYRQASQWDRLPQPGLAQLRLAQGQVDAANAAIRLVLDAVNETGSRSRILDAFVEIALASNDLVAARGAADELSGIASRYAVPFLDATSARAKGAVLLAEGDPRGALAALRQAWNLWCELEAPYEAARVRVLIALACREQGDEDTAELELALARQTFSQLGAATDIAHVETLSRRSRPFMPGSLTVREVEVLRLVASGVTNRDIAEKLNISEKTVARHMSNIFTKLDLPSRAAATAYAYQHKLI